MKDLLKIILITLWVFLPLDKALALATAPTGAPSLPPAPKPIEVTADSVQQDSANHIIKARGNVVVFYEGKTVHADRLTVNSETGIGHAEGHVVITEENGSRLTGKQSKFKLKTHQGKLYNAKGILVGKGPMLGASRKVPVNTGAGTTSIPPRDDIPSPSTAQNTKAGATSSPIPGGIPSATAPATAQNTGAGARPTSSTSPGGMPNTSNAQGNIEYYVTGKELVKVGDTHYTGTQASLTTCKGKLPDWMIQAEATDMQMGDRALFKNGIIKVHDVPVFFVPYGYVPLDQERKSGFLTPVAGYGNLNGTTLNNAFYWAINRWSDATFMADYMSKRGVRPGIEYRYTPAQNTAGYFSANYLDDKSLKQQFYTVHWLHNQNFTEDNASINAKLELQGTNNPNKVLSENVDTRTSRNTDSYLAANKAWGNTSVSFISQYKASTVGQNAAGQTVEDNFALLPQAILRTQKISIGNSPVYFNQETSFSAFYSNLDPSKITKDYTTINRVDFHPQLSLPFRPTPWLSVTPTAGLRETYYSQGVDAADYHNRLPGFSRQLFDLGATFEGPKFSKIYFADGGDISPFKHTIEPSVTYSYIPDNKETINRSKIKVFDSVDMVGSINRTTYYLTQRILQKNVINEDISETRDILKFEVSQSYDARATTQSLPNGYAAFSPQGQTKVGFSPIRFDLTSRPMNQLMLNANTTYDPYVNEIKTLNFEVGIKPSKLLSLLLERRYTRDTTTYMTGGVQQTIPGTTFDTATATLTLPKGWKLQYTTRYDESLTRFMENDVSLGFNDPCRCWGLSFDYIKRNIYNLNIVQPETMFMFNLNLLGMGSYGSGQQQLLHRDF